MRKLFKWTSATGALLLGLLTTTSQAVPIKKSLDKIRVVILDGQNNHQWRLTTPVMKKALEDTGRFTVDVATAPEMPRRPQPPKKKTDESEAKYKEQMAKYEKAQSVYRTEMARFRPDFGKYQVVLSNYNGDRWPQETSDALESAVREGKVGLVIVHAANNSFGGWKEYNQMIGMGWRDAKYGRRLKVDEDGKEVIVPKGEDQGSSHRYTGPFSVVIRDPEHPITKGMPREWQHARDELYDNMRGPIEHVHLLATAYSKGTKTNEPMIWTVTYGKGRVFHTPMGHDVGAMYCVGFLTTLARGTEWAATGAVTLPIPSNFPTEKKASTVKGK